MTTTPSALLVADAPGQILDRVASSFVRRHPYPHTVRYSISEHPWLIARQAQRAGVVHWINRLAFADQAAMAPVPQVVMVHHMNNPEIQPTIDLLPSADAITTSSIRWQRRLIELTGREVTVIPYTVDTEIFVPVNDRAEARRAAGIAEDAFVIAYSGKSGANAYGRKGIDILTAILHEAVRRWNATSLLIGSGWDDLAAELTAAGGTVVRRQPNTTEETAKWYPLADVLVSTSREEGGPCTILEAMSCEVPILTTDVGHVPETVRHGQNGFICGFDAADFVKHIEELRSNRELVTMLSKNGRRTMTAERDERIVIPKVDFNAIYGHAMSTFARRSPFELRARAIRRAATGVRYAGMMTRDALLHRGRRSHA